MKRTFLSRASLFIMLVIYIFSGDSFSAKAVVDCFDLEAICKDDCLPSEQQVGYCNNNLSKCCKARVAQEEIVSTGIENPLAFDTVQGLLDSVLGTLQAIIGVISLIFIVIGGILYVTSAGDEGKMRMAKGAITASLVGLALGIGAPSFLKQIGEVLDWGDIGSGPVQDAKTLSDIAINVLNFLLSTVGVVAIIMMVIGGMMYLTAAGDEHRIDVGKSIVKYSIIGVAITLGALVLVNQIASFFV